VVQIGRVNGGDSHWGYDLRAAGWTNVHDGDDNNNNNSNNNNSVVCYNIADTTNRPVTATALGQKVDTSSN